MSENVVEDMSVIRAAEQESIVYEFKKRIEMKNYQNLVNSGVEKLKNKGMNEKDLDLYL